MKKIMNQFMFVESLLSFINMIGIFINGILNIRNMNNLGTLILIMSFLAAIILFIRIIIKLIKSISTGHELNSIQIKIHKYIDNHKEDYYKSDIYKVDPHNRDYINVFDLNYNPMVKISRIEQFKIERQYFVNRLSFEYPELTCKKLNEIIDIYYN